MKKPTLIYGIVGAVALMLCATPGTAAYAQEVFESEQYGFRIQIPQGWVAQDLTEMPFFDPVREIGVYPIAEICKQNESLPAIGGGYNCLDGIKYTGTVRINALDLENIEEIEGLIEGNKTITTNDLLAMQINQSQFLDGNSNYSIEDITDINEFIKIVSMTFDTPNPEAGLLDPQTYRRGLTVLSALSPDRSMGYEVMVPILHNYPNLGLGGNGEAYDYTDDLIQLLKSFEIIPPQ